MTFSDLFPFVLKWEGGVSDDAADAGGLTKYGVSTAFLQDLAKNKPSVLKKCGVPTEITSAVVHSLTKRQACDLFKSEFWDALNLDELSKAYPRLACVMCDTGINMGAGTARKLMQRAVGAVADGKIGPKTMSALRATGDVLASLNMLDFRRIRYQKIVDSKPSQKVFFKGWMNRTADLQRFVSNLGEADND